MRSILPALGLTRRARRRLRLAFGALGFLLVAGTLGFYWLEDWTLAESLYVTVTTLATVGYGDYHPSSPLSRAFATTFMLFSIATVGLLLSAAIQSLVEAELDETFGRRRRRREMNRLSNHVIVCGAGRVGARVIRELRRAGEPFVVVERDAQQVVGLSEEGAPVLIGDATLEETLRGAGVERARALAACLPDDAANVYAVLTARGLSPDLHIVARAVEEQAEPKLVRAGANRVISPTIIGSHRMTQALLRPAVGELLDSLAAEHLDFNLEQVEITRDSPYVGRKLRYTNTRSELDAVVVAIRRRGGQMIFNPSPDSIIEAGDQLIAAGRAESLAELKTQARPKE
ncbi:MAG TPA: NAD-binding protein [Pyrinomonadaceae bacterium]|nr:NAD-binding protein [Pyrinomonadaceae bacterium]